jgi:hypothetical protein
MADSNNHLTAQLSAEPYPQLRTLDRLVGQWQTTRTVPPWRHELRMDGGRILPNPARRRQRRRSPDQGHRIHRLRRATRRCARATWTSTAPTPPTPGNSTATRSGSGSARKARTRLRTHFSEDGNSYTGAWQWPATQARSRALQALASRSRHRQARDTRTNDELRRRAQS